MRRLPCIIKHLFASYVILIEHYTVVCNYKSFLQYAPPHAACGGSYFGFGSRLISIHHLFPNILLNMLPLSNIRPLTVINPDSILTALSNHNCHPHCSNAREHFVRTNSFFAVTQHTSIHTHASLTTRRQQCTSVSVFHLIGIYRFVGIIFLISSIDSRAVL